LCGKKKKKKKKLKQAQDFDSLSRESTHDNKKSQ